jgi:hypothetical protein
MGYYEREVQPAVITLISRRPRTIYNIGCASGYYAIGFARHLGETTVHAYDINEKSLEICREYAEKNGVGDRVITKKGIEHIPDLPKSIPESLYIVDTEGWEEFFFPKGEDFLASDLLIECHHRLENPDILTPVIDVLLPRFERTHQVTVIKPENCHVLFRLGIEWPMLTQYSTLVDTRPQGHCWLLALSKQNARLEPPKAC